MEIGAVKHALNSEIIRIKSGLNQARTHTINKLTRKSKVFKMRKGPDKVLEKFNRKAEAYLAEVFIIKKIKAKELVRFAITCDKNLRKYIDHPEVNKEKAMARMLLHKSLEDKTNLLKEMFGNMPIEELMMTRRERLKIKKEKKEKEKEKQEKKLKQKKPCGEVDNVREENDVDSEEDGDYSGRGDDDDENEHLDSDGLDDLESSADEGNDNINEMKQVKTHNTLETDEDLEFKTENYNDDDERESSKSTESELLGDKKICLNNKDNNLPQPNSITQYNDKSQDSVKHKLPSITVTKTAPTKKSTSKNKKIVKPQLKKKGKLQKRLQKVECAIDDEQKAEGKIVDSFFITSTGNYKTLAEPRLPDDLGKVDYSRNRQMRRAAAFGRTYKPKLNKNFKEYQSPTGRQDRNQDRKPDQNNRFNKALSTKKENDIDKFSSKKRVTDVSLTFSKKPILDKRKSASTETINNKIHPSWEAKKKASGIQAFQGKKVVFDNE